MYSLYSMCSYNMFLKKLKIELPYDPAIPLLGIYPENTIIQNDTCTPMFIVTLLTIDRTWKQAKSPSTEEWIKKVWYTESWSSAPGSWTSLLPLPLQLLTANLLQLCSHHGMNLRHSSVSSSWNQWENQQEDKRAGSMSMWGTGCHAILFIDLLFKKLNYSWFKILC